MTFMPSETQRNKIMTRWEQSIKSIEYFEQEKSKVEGKETSQ